MTVKIDQKKAKSIWLQSQRLDVASPFGTQPQAVTQAVRHLGYVQIDTIHVIERCHHHILYNRIPGYRRSYLKKAQSIDKSIFEYWTHALSYVPTEHYRYFVNQMKSIDTGEGSWFGRVSETDYKKVLKILKNGPVSIRDIKDDVLKEKAHEWDSKKPSKRALQLGFYRGDFVVCEREGMLKKYDLASRHFAWDRKPKAAVESECNRYLVDRALRAQGLVSLDSICHLNAKKKPEIINEIQLRLKKKKLIELQIKGAEKISFWAEPNVLEKKMEVSQQTHILSPFDPLIIQRKRLALFFDYNHIFEAYIPKSNRKFGYFSLPVLVGNEFMALLDLKTDRVKNELIIQNWVWLKKYKSLKIKKLIENELHRFEKFQLSAD